MGNEARVGPGSRPRRAEASRAPGDLRAPPGHARRGERPCERGAVLWQWAKPARESGSLQEGYKLPEKTIN